MNFYENYYTQEVYLYIFYHNGDSPFCTLYQLALP